MGAKKKKQGNLFYIRKKGSLAFYLVLFFFAGGYLLFFSSHVWMPASLSASLQTALGEEVQWAGRTLKVIRWDYCEETERMEVELELRNDTFDGVDQYRFHAAVRGSGKPVVETVIGDPDWIILQIQDVPGSFGELSLRMDLPQEQEGVETLKLYTNVNAVNRVSRLEKKDRTGYQKERALFLIEGYRKEIQEKQDSIKALENQDRKMQEEIGRLQKDTGYQTKEQMQETESRIMEIEGDRKGKAGEREKLQQEIRELEERIQLTEKQVADLGKE